MLMMTVTVELSRIDFLCHAVALNLEGARVDAQEAAATDTVRGAIRDGAGQYHILSSGLSPMPVNANGVPVDMNTVHATGNLTAESGDRMLASRLYNMTEETGMKDMPSFPIARNTMHQQRWLAMIEEL